MDIKEVLKQYNELCEDNDWNVYHTPKNLASAISVASSHILEHFQWVTEEDSLSYGLLSKNKDQVADEIADTFFYLMALAGKMGIDMEQAISNKLQRDTATHVGAPDEFEDLD